MNNIIEISYSFIESILITFFLSMYFETKPKVSKAFDITVSFLMILTFNITVTLLDLSWIIIFCVFILLLLIILEVFYQGTLLEHLLISIIACLLLALTDICVFTLMSKILGLKYDELVTRSDLSRFLTVIITKVIYLINISIIISFKRKYTLMLHSIEYVVISVTLIISCVLVTFVRNIVYRSEKNYNAFLVIILCVILINVLQYYTMVYISKKNISEKNMLVMQKYIEMQADSIYNLEQKYDETAKIRHDIKNYILCALDMAEHDEISDLVNYLKELSGYKIDNINSYIKTKRKVLGAVINSKIGIAKQKGFEMQCIILNELDNIVDIDAGIMLANLLDNAIEACEKNKNHSEIMLKIWDEAGYYCIEVSNTVEQDVLVTNYDLNTNKTNKSLHGIGLKSVNDIVSKYKGIINFTQKSNKFYAYVSLNTDDKL